MAVDKTFSILKYKSDAGGVYSIRMSQAATGISGSSDPTEALTDGRVKVSVSKHGQKRVSGIKARGLSIGLPDAANAGKYTSKTFVPIQTKTAFDAYQINATVTYEGAQWKILDKIAEA